MADPATVKPPSKMDEVSWQDISFAGVAKSQDPLDVLRQRLEATAKLPPDQQKSSKTRLSCALAYYYLDQPRDALDILDELIQQPSPPANVFCYRAICLAQLGKTDEAKKAVAKLADVSKISGYAAYALILTNAWLGEVDHAKNDLDQLVLTHPGDATALYNAACAAAQLARIWAESNPAEMTALKERLMRLLRAAYGAGHRGTNGVENDPDFAPLYGDPDFQALVSGLVPPRYYAAVWRRTHQFESWCDAGLSLDKQQETARQRIEAGCRPVGGRQWFGRSGRPAIGRNLAAAACQTSRVGSGTAHDVHRVFPNLVR